MTAHAMTTTTLTARAALLALAGALAGAIGGCDAAPARTADAAAADPAGTSAHAHHGPGAPSAEGLPGMSVYHATSAWTDQAGVRRELVSLAGAPRLVAMLYTSCGYACPRTILDMKRIEDGLGDDAGRVGFVIASIDPRRDTPDQLARFAAGARLPADRWTLLTSDDDGVLELAALLGVRYRETSTGEFVHGNRITLLDADGRIVHHQEGLEADPAATLAAIRRLLD